MTPLPPPSETNLVIFALVALVLYLAGCWGVGWVLDRGVGDDEVDGAV